MDSLKIRVQDICRRLKDTPFIDVTKKDEEITSLDDVLEREILNSPQDIQKRLLEEFHEDGPLTSLLLDPLVNEIIVNGWESVWFEKEGQFHKSPDTFLSPTTYHNYIQRLCKKLKTQITMNDPFTCASDQNIRYHLVSPNITHQDYSLTIRKHIKTNWTFLDLLKNQTMSLNQFKFLQGIIKERKNILVIGPTSSGKTTFLNCCLQEFPPDSRSVLMEDTKELFLPNDLSTRLLTRGDAGQLITPIDLTLLLKEALRMRPDRLVMGEVRGVEAKDLLLALSTGHQGSIGTLHANSAKEALLRLEMLIQLGAPQWSLSSIRRLIFLSVHYLIVLKTENGKRKLESIHRISGLEDFGLLLEEIN